MKPEEPPIVLYAEDDENDAFFMRRAFRKAGMRETLLVAQNGSEAIARLGEKPLPHFALLDIKMPMVSGLQVLAWIRENLGPGLPVFMLSSSSQERDIGEARRLAANGYLLKPSNAELLADALVFLRDFCAQPARLSREWVQFSGAKPVATPRT